MTQELKKQRHKNILHWDDERSLGNSLIVALVPGKQFNADVGTGEHTRGFDTVNEAMSEVRSAVDCSCDDCKEKLSTMNVLPDGTIIKNKLSGSLAEVVHPTNKLVTYFVHENGTEGECSTSETMNLFDVADASTTAQFVSSFIDTMAS